MRPTTTPSKPTAWSRLLTAAAPVNVAAAGLEEVAEPAADVDAAWVVAAAVDGAAEELAGGALLAAPGSVMVTPPERQYCWANVRVARRSQV